jgi:hypothetical protein
VLFWEPLRSVALRQAVKIGNKYPACPFSKMQETLKFEQSAAFKYWAFISYSHDDRKWAEWLHRCLDTYRVPKPLVGHNSADGPRPRRLFPIFLDTAELAASPNLPDSIIEALRQSRYLIVVCSPRAAQSRWVNEEIKAFKQLGRQDRVFGLIVDGEPNASDGIMGVSIDQECFPEPMRYRYAANGIASIEKANPLAPDVRPGMEGRASARLRLLAGVLGVGFDTLRQREHQRFVQRLFWIGIGAIILGAAFVFLGEEAKKNAELKRQALTDSYFRTIGSSNTEILPRDEREALWELAQLDRTDATVRVQLLNRWFQTIDAFTRGENRGEQGMLAATGLNDEFRRLAARNAANLGWNVCTALDIAQITDADELLRLCQMLPALVTKMEPQAASEIAKRAAQRLVVGLENAQVAELDFAHEKEDEDREAAKYSERLARLGELLMTLTAKLKPEAAAEIASGIVAALEAAPTIDSDKLARLVALLEVLATKMGPSAAVEIAKGLTAALENSDGTNPNRLSSFSEALVALANKIDQQTAADIARRAAKRLVATLEVPQMANSDLLSLEQALVALANKIEQQTAADMAKRGAKRLVAALETAQTIDFEEFGKLGKALVALANKMGPDASADIAKRGAQRIVVVLETAHETDSGDFADLTAALVALRDNLKSQAAGEIAKGLAAALENPQVAGDARLSGLSAALAALANKIEPHDAGEIAQGLAATLENAQVTDYQRLSGLGAALVALANEIEPHDAGEIAKGLAATLENPQVTDYNRLSGLGAALVALANEIEPHAAGEIAQGLAGALENPQVTGDDRLSGLSAALVALANKLEPHVASETAKGLGAALENLQGIDYHRLSNLGLALVTLTNRMQPQAVCEITRPVTQRLVAALKTEPITDDERLVRLREVLATLAAKMQPQDTAGIAKDLTTGFVNSQETDFSRLSSLGDALVALVNEVKPQAAAEVAQGIVAVLKTQRIRESYQLSKLGEALVHLIAKTEEPQIAQELATRSVQGIVTALKTAQITNSYQLSNLGETVAALAAKLEPQAAWDITKPVAQRLFAALEIDQTTNSEELPLLGEALAALALEMEPQTALQITKPATQRLVTALESEQITDSKKLLRLGEALAALAATLDRQNAAEMAKDLVKSLENPQQISSDQLVRRGQILGAFCMLLPSAYQTHLLAISNLLLTPTSKKQNRGDEEAGHQKLLVAMCAQLRLEDLAEVLKYPFCTSEAKQIVFNQTEAITGRDFGGNVWKFVDQANLLEVYDVYSPAKRPKTQDVLKELDQIGAHQLK